jgi:glutamyl-tRNA synthetase
MVKAFDLTAVSKSNAVFDPEKLAWMNSEYLRALPAERLLPLVREELESAGWLGETGIQDSGVSLPAGKAGSQEENRIAFESTVRLLQTRARSIKDFSGAFRAFFSDQFDYDPEAVKRFWKDASLPDLLSALAERLAQTEPFDVQETEKTLRSLAEEKSVKAGLLINASRVALTGQGVAPGLFEVMTVLGRERAVNRLRQAAEYLARKVTSGE